MCIASLFSFAGCSLVKTDNTVVNSGAVVKIGNTTLTKNDIINAFSTYYQNNSSYFAYYSDSVIEDSFYQWAIVRQMLNDMSFDALYDAEKNPDGFIYYTDEDAKTVWKNVCDYIYSQVSTNEKSIYKLNGYEEDQYPTWIKSSDEDSSDKTFEFYKKPEIKDIAPDAKDHVVKKLTEDEVKSKIKALKDYLFEYVTKTDDEGNEERASIDETTYISGARNQAYATYISLLVSSAKSSGTSTDENVCLENEVIRIYNAYYNSQITSNFQSYYLNDYLTNNGNNGDKNALGNDIIVKSFLETYYAQKQNNSSEKAYIDTITSSDGASLILYSYNGQNYFFSVQHILVKFTDYVQEQVKALEGYNSSSSSDYDEVISKLYKENRNRLAEDYKLSMLTPINEKNEFDTVKIFGDYYYYDADQKEVYDTTKNIFNGYIKLEKTETTDADGKTTVTYTDSQGNSDYDAEKVQYMATVSQILEAYDYNYSAWKAIIENYYNGSLSREDAVKDYKDMEYIFDTVDNMKENSYTLAQIESKVSSYLFVELQWVYSSDTLDNKLSNKIGYVISNFDDENGSWVSDFANGSRELVRKIKSGEIDIDAILASGDVSRLTNTIVSDYGYHIIKVDNIYEVNSSIGGVDELINSLVDAGYPISFDSSTEQGKHFVDEIVKFMKKTYVCASSNETLFDYFYDEIYTGYVGSGNSSGTYFVGLEYKWLNEYYKIGKIEFVNKMTYSELVDAIN